MLLNRNFFFYFIKQRYCQDQILKIRNQLYFNIFLDLVNKTNCLNTQLDVSLKNNTAITNNSFIIFSSNQLSYSYNYYYLYINKLFLLNFPKNNAYNIKDVNLLCTSKIQTINFNTQRLDIQKSLININGWKKDTKLYQIYIINYLLYLLLYDNKYNKNYLHLFQKEFNNNYLYHSLSFLFWKKLTIYLYFINNIIFKSFFLENLFLSKWKNK